MLPGGIEWLVIGGVVILLFGVNKLPKLGGAIGESIKNFKKGIKDQEKLESGSDADGKSGKKSTDADQ